MKDWQKAFRNVREALETKRYIAEDEQKSAEDWETSQYYAGKASALKEALETLQVFEKEP